jgi:hypothetical protein
MKTKEYPKSAFRFQTELQIEQGQESPTVRMLARSEKPIDHWYWGKVAHDNSGAQFKESIPLDYCHDDKEIVGFANSENIKVNDSGALEIEGTITPFTEGDRASEILAKSKMGVPYEASINFAGDGLKIEEIKPGKTGEVNGYTFEGPGVIIREWPLRGVAVCPYGADGNTASEFKSLTDVISVAVLERDSMTTEEKEAPEVAAEPAAEKELSNSQPAKPEVQPEDLRAEGKKFIKAFGAENGAKYFADDLSFEDAMVKFCVELKDENDRLKAEIKHLNSSSSEAIPVAAESEEIKRSGFASKFKIPSSN